ncbi:copper chaperone PCu(A)C [Starkeya sp. ORNL1]|uniref:copper chaperone PCu(A)C n=1 Tax=Starkeya sp. ORNL1 TaxID=2709380 RepID=UPI001463EE0A|nr:copper chaperone PCu(A)C [Starkeya sp. ORNL1]QJP17081.1 copper chaperone PCu(A)C [Starkeya sp. ORNL1]
MLNTLRHRLLARIEDRIGLATLAAAIVLFTAHGAFAHEYKAGDLEIAHPWVRMTPGGAKVGGGYVTIENHGTAPDRLVAVTSDVADHVEIHQMSEKDGVMTMRMIEGGVEVPANGKLALSPGGYHLMMIGLKQPLKQGERIKGTLTFEKAGTVAVEFAVEGMGGPKGQAPDSAMPGHDMHNMPSN